MKTMKPLLTLGLMLTAACGGLESPEATTAQAALRGSSVDVDVSGAEADLYARVSLDGRADFAMQLQDGAWVEGTAQLVRPSAQDMSETVAQDFAEALYAQLNNKKRHTYVAPCTDEEGCDASRISFILTGAEPHKPVEAEPHLDGAEPHDDAEAEPHKPKPKAEPHAPKLVAAEPH